MPDNGGKGYLYPHAHFEAGDITGETKNTSQAAKVKPMYDEIFETAKNAATFKWNELVEAQHSLEKKIGKFIEEFGQMPDSDKALRSMHFGGAHLIHSYTHLYTKFMKAVEK